MSCADHENYQSDCFECMDLQEKVRKYQCHRHTTTCAKKKKCMTIKEIEGHGRFDGFNVGPKLSNISVCRFHFPKFPLNKTELIIGISKDMDEKIVKKRQEDLNKIIKFLIRKTCD